jgi:hypothetical protein
MFELVLINSSIGHIIQAAMRADAGERIGVE